MKTHQDVGTVVGHIQVVRHAQVCQKLQISSAKLFDLVAQGIFPKPFKLIPKGRAVGWLECDVDAWVLDRKSEGSQHTAGGI
jgi:prophage regulatory protein